MRQAVDPEQEAVWVAAAQAGDTQAFEALVRAYQGPAYTMAYRVLGHAEEAREATQDAFLNAYRAIRRFRGRCRYATWLFAIVINTARKRRRALGSRRWFTTESLEAARSADDPRPRHEPADPGLTAGEAAIAREEREILLRSLQALRADAREVIVLRDIQGMSYEDVAAILGCRIGTVKSRLHRARAALVAAMREVMT